MVMARGAVALTEGQVVHGVEEDASHDENMTYLRGFGCFLILLEV
jgi:hypothetical protein